MKVKNPVKKVAGQATAAIVSPLLTVDEAAAYLRRPRRWVYYTLRYEIPVAVTDAQDWPDWTADAACRDLPTALFFPADGDEDTTERAKAVCRSCPVRTDCATYALADPKLEGVWGASTEVQRRNRRRQLRRTG